MNYSSFGQLKLKDFTAKSCQLKESDFSECELKESIFTGSDLAKANFNNAQLSKANFELAQNYFIDPMLSNIKGAKFSIPEALSFFKVLGIEVN